MKNKLEQTYTFLLENRRFNHSLQERYYQNIILPCNDKEEKIMSSLYHTANTQSKPNIDYLSKFYKIIFQDPSCMSSMLSFVNKINSVGPLNFGSLFEGMKKHAGWGDKTSALFTKSIYQLHCGKYAENLTIWEDVPKTISDDDSFYLPVDSVIIAIFNQLDGTIKWDFGKINKAIKETYNYKNKDIEVWDDLWFWGFITQKGSGINRVFEWNENKYWVLKESDKKNKIIKEIKQKAELFLEILEN